MNQVLNGDCLMTNHYIHMAARWQKHSRPNQDGKIVSLDLKGCVWKGQVHPFIFKGNICTAEYVIYISKNIDGRSSLGLTIILLNIGN